MGLFDAGFFDAIGKVTDTIKSLSGTKTTRDTLSPADKPQIDKEANTAYVRPTQDE